MINKVYIIAPRNNMEPRAHRKIFALRKDALAYWERLGKVEYTYWEEQLF